MTPAQELCIKVAMAIVALLTIGPAMYLFGKVLLLPIVGQTYAFLIAAVFGFVAWLLIASWFKRQFDEWWGHVQ